MRSAFTVIEVIVTFVILSILIFFSIYTFRYSIANVQRATYYLPKDAAAYRMLDRVISGAFYYEMEVKKQEFAEYFYADQTSFKFITSAPPFSQKLSIVSITLDANTLYLYVQPFYHRYTNLNKPDFTKHIPIRTLVLYENIKSMHISYIMYNKETLSHVKNQMPKGIVLDIETKTEKFKLVFSIMTQSIGNRTKVYYDSYQL